MPKKVNLYRGSWDSRVEALREKRVPPQPRPRWIRGFAVLIVIIVPCSLLSELASLLSRTAGPDTAANPALILFALVFSGVLAGVELAVAWGLWHYKNWARLGFIVVIIFDTLVSLPNWFSQAASPFYAPSDQAISFLIILGGLIFRGCVIAVFAANGRYFEGGPTSGRRQRPTTDSLRLGAENPTRSLDTSPQEHLVDSVAANAEQTFRPAAAPRELLTTDLDSATSEPTLTAATAPHELQPTNSIRTITRQTVRTPAAPLDAEPPISSMRLNLVLVVVALAIVLGLIAYFFAGFSR